MPPPKSAKTFTANLERMPGNLGWVIIRIPFDAAKLWGKRGQLRVKGEISRGGKAAGFPFRTSLFPNGRGGHYLLVNKKMQQGAGTIVGMSASFRMEPDLEKKVVTEPKELKAMLKESKALDGYYRSLTPSTRHEIAKWIEQPKGQGTRERRAEQMAERLLATMEAERELPPMIRRAMAMEPKAALGWQRMPPSHKRSHLLGIFYYRTPEARERRLQKAIEMMVEYAEKPVKKTPPE
ncbi:MAG TPA: YdeI/OmpD-associated family protein [Terriglobales bacterium]|nr:YdeI/OmpD-associated family protein [Terriglobales bacterium]